MVFRFGLRKHKTNASTCRRERYVEINAKPFFDETRYVRLVTFSRTIREGDCKHKCPVIVRAEEIVADFHGHFCGK